MSQLTIYHQDHPTQALLSLAQHEAIAAELNQVGIRFERWAANQPLEPGASEPEVIAAYHQDIERLRREEGYQAVDVVSLVPDHPQREAMRQKFLSEHTHTEDEVRFFVAGAGTFTLHIGERVYAVLCEQGDLIGVPDGTRHWFDMSEAPYFVAIRLFTHPEGWVGHFTGDDIAKRFPRMSPHASALELQAA